MVSRPIDEMSLGELNYIYWLADQPGLKVDPCFLAQLKDQLGRKMQKPRFDSEFIDEYIFSDIE
jgi:hypothetical protein